jgi:chromosome segregation ATPase
VKKGLDAAIACVSSLLASMQAERIDLAEMLASMPEMQALLNAEREAAKKDREAAKKDREAAAQRISNLEQERDNLRASHERLRLELELFKRRLFIAKAERAEDVPQLQLRFEQMRRELDEMAGTLGMGKQPEREAKQTPARDGKPCGKRGTRARAGEIFASSRSRKCASRSRTRTSKS